MSIFKNVHIKFWQNDFVLGLTAEERYFYIYLITNSMTNQCGIYKFNRRLVELETGYSCDKIESFLKKFEEYGKVVISCSTTEIMLVNWFKHNFKSNKKTLQSVNKELKDVKDKELLQKLYDYCCKRQYPVKEIFNGVILLEGLMEKDNSRVEERSEVASKVEETKSEVQGAVDIYVGLTNEESKSMNDNTAAPPLLISNFQIGNGEPVEGEIDEGYQSEDSVVLEDSPEEDMEEVSEGTTIAIWDFGGDGTDIEVVECSYYEDVAARNTAYSL